MLKFGIKAFDLSDLKKSKPKTARPIMKRARLCLKKNLLERAIFSLRLPSLMSAAKKL